MIFVKDAKDLRFLRVNRAGEKLLGVRQQELLGKNDYDLFPREQADFFTGKDREVLAGRNAVDIPEEPIQTESGTRYLHTKKIPLFGADGRPLYLLGISEDITERKNAEIQRLNLLQEQTARAEAEKSAVRLRFLADASSTLTESLNMATVLARFAEVLVRDFAEMCVINVINEQGDGLDTAAIAHRDPKAAARARELLAHRPLLLDAPEGASVVIRTGEPLMMKTVPASGGGVLRAEDVASFEVRSLLIVPLKSYGKVMGAISFLATDGSPRYDELDLSVAMDLARRASATLENASLFRRAQEASRAKSAFLANTSHEIRTPLGAMIGFTELALDDKTLPPEIADYLATVLRNGRELLRIVDEILDLSKVESERIHLEPAPFDPRQLVEEVGALLGMRAREKGLDFDIDIDASVPHRVITDRTRLRQILVNIVGNAVKFTDRGVVHVDVRMKTSSIPNRPVFEVRVVDSGIGIAPAERGKLFEPFMQADASMTRRFGGTGLGLFVSRKLAQLLGGDLSLAESTPGHGSVFVMTAQVLLPPVDAAVTHRDASTRASPAAPSKLLIVDDSADNRSLLKHLLTRDGHSCEVAENGAKAVEAALNGDFDLILMDLQMPEMDGERALSLLRARGYAKPVIAVTAHAMKGDRERSLAHGFDDYLTKPLDTETLRRALARLLPARETAPSKPA